MLDRAILAKFLIHRVSVKTSLSKFQRIFHLSKMAAILNFRIFFKNARHKNACIMKTMQERAILFLLVCKQITLPYFPPKIYPSQKWGSLSIFKFVTKFVKHQIASVSLTMLDRAISSKFFETHCIQDNYPAQEPLFPYPGFVEL